MRLNFTAKILMAVAVVAVLFNAGPANAGHCVQQVQQVQAVVQSVVTTPLVAPGSQFYAVPQATAGFAPSFSSTLVVPGRVVGVVQPIVAAPIVQQQAVYAAPLVQQQVVQKVIKQRNVRQNVLVRQRIRIR